MGRNDSYNQIYCNTTAITRTTTTIFLPFLCRISTKDAVKFSEPSPCPKKNEPSSPKVGCMGQIKRHSNSKISSSTTPTPGKLKYTQLKKMFSGRNLLMATTTNPAHNGTYCKWNNNTKIDTSVRKRPKFHNRDRGNCAVVVPLNLAELDPPLPVVKPSCGSRREGSLWKRRGGVAPLEGLQIQQINIQLPCNNSADLLPPSPVS